MKKYFFIIILPLVISSLALAGLSEVQPEQVGLDAARLAWIDAAVERAIADRQVPGAVVLVGRRGKVVFAKAYGRRAIVPKSEPMTRDTIFDMASLTKPVATATSILILLERGQIRLSDRLGRLWPEMDRKGKGAITVEQLLRHRSGLIADNPVSDYEDGPEAAWERIAALDLVAQPEEKFIYSDVNFLILGRLVERISGQPLDVFAHENIFKPLGMGNTQFRPVAADAKTLLPVDRVAPTEKVDDRMLRGVVHDPRARALGGVAGHAGLFSTADDLAIYAQMILDGGRGPDGHRVLSPLTVRKMIDAGDTPPGQRRGLGWDIATSSSAPRGELFGPESFGHTGFTGTTIWIDPETATFVIVLTSRLHPDGKAPSPTPLRAQVATLAAAAIVDAPTRAVAPKPIAEPPHQANQDSLHPVVCGIDVLIKREFEGLRGKRIGLVTNHTGQTRDGRATIDVLFHAPEIHLVALYCPEHGIRGQLDAAVPDSKDDATGLPIWSLYGKTHRPTREMLEGVDVLVYDIQDIGVRYYTYITTLGLVLEAARERGIPVMVLDRPNPIGGIAVDGPVRDEEFASFIAYHALPVRHGMTVGELARLFNAERKIGAELTVVPCEGWHRCDFFDRTGLVWVNPSPNMRSLTEALLYPGVGLLEATNLSVGRGTDTPFERIGAPWIEPRGFAQALNALKLPGVRFVPFRFTPNARQYAGQECGGVQIAITDWSRFNPLDLGLGLAVVLRRLYPEQWRPEGFLKMLADRAAYQALRDGQDIKAIRATWQAELEEFQRVRSRYLLYP
jgi:uncharacterized protein YbbC (DUF1343 family)/CubicO group peptidase (beta-lactamase class C family)